MPTAAERQALMFLAAVAVIGTGARVAHSARFTREVASAERLSSTPEDSSAVGHQIDAIDSARASSRGSSRARTPRGSKKPSPNTSRDDPELPIPKRQKVSPLPPTAVDLNQATAAEIERLPRIGPALAQRIVAWRDAHGPFRSLDDLRHVRGIGPATTALLAPSVTF